MKQMSIEAIRVEGFDCPIEKALARDFGEALRGVGGSRHEAPTASGGDDDDTHKLAMSG